MPPRKKKAEKVASNSIVVLTTSIGEPLVIRANPTDEAVRGFVEVQTQRYLAGLPGGPAGIPAYRIFGAERYSSEIDYLTGVDPTVAIDISDLLPTP